jgi:glycosyltransferase involved in cell wall biosynthesis
VHPKWRPSHQRGVVVGYFGSNNGSNIDAITSFVRDAWPKVQAAISHAELLIGGTISECGAVAELGNVPHVRLQRHFTTTSAFYHSVDLVINPVRFGTGLKIKTVEALAFGRPVVTTTGGRVGIPAALSEACDVADDPDEMAALIVKRLSDRDELARLSEQVFEIAQIELSDGKVLNEFRSALLANGK